MAFAFLLIALFPIASYASKSASAPTTVSLNTLFFDFGNNLVGHPMTQTAVVVTNTGKTTLSMSPALAGDPSYSIVLQESCGAQLAPGKSCDMVVRYAPGNPSYPKAQRATLNMHFANAALGVPGSVAIAGVSARLQPGKVTPTNNPQVALYSIKLPFPGRMKVVFGPTKAYGFRTWYRGTDVGNGMVSMYVAGMKANTKYHMAASVQFRNSITVMDTDHTFTTGSVPASLQLKVTATTAPGMKPQPGIEFTNPLNGLVAYDLDGNPIWTYQGAYAPALDTLYGVKLLANGHILLVLGEFPEAPLQNPIPEGGVREIREIDLAGNTVRELTISDLNAELATAPASCTECKNLYLYSFHHDVTPLPNGHTLVLVDTTRNLSPTSTPPLTTSPPQKVLGDVIVDLDENWQPVWVWNEFNHLDPNRHPYLFPDWTHTNAVLYSADDHNILVSIRHQNWVVKVNYNDGQGNGDILWRLGQGGDFKLVGGVDPTDWQYAQHDPGYFSPNTSGVFSLGIMDNGDDRRYPAGNKCQPGGNLPKQCLYSTIPVFKIDETAKTATLTFHQILPPELYSNFGGNTEELANGNVEYDLCGVGLSSQVREVTQEKVPQAVWSMSLTGSFFYRAFRVPSLYPGVQW
ncbi:MAG TPA: aryl-sulfate sulfotransferase [Terracidiphilus sp.]|nr:aryl-sulfate sulfotransferase [Terracidiphilus sp.]